MRDALLGAIMIYAASSAAAETYETAAYKVLESANDIEVREYPDLALAVTTGKIDAQGRDGSFMRLFGYISGANEDQQKIAMTTPVFMEGGGEARGMEMGFVMPKETVAQGLPAPTGKDVKLHTRRGGRFAVIRFAGRLDWKLATKSERQLREWMRERGLDGEAGFEAAGYDPPFTPAKLRRNEVLIRIKESSPQTDSISHDVGTAP
ncbi:MAG: heme-binding protein [Planctomycetales bacterium]|nr:heme-binding protein [Planctomycetales bacterium]